MDILYITRALCLFYFGIQNIRADIALVGELNVLNIGSHISMAPLNTLAFNSLDLGSMGDPHGVEWDPKDSMVYWTDRKKGTINRARPNGRNRKIILRNAQGPHGITIDKEDRVMYWTEEGRRSIWRANLDGTNRTRIIYTDLKEPGDMQLDPVEKRLYWLDENGIHSKIESAKVDGTDRKTLLVNSLRKTWLKHPTGISLDILERKIYWCDDVLDYIGTMDMNGSHPFNLFDKSHWWVPDLLFQPESLAVYKDYIYFVELLGFQVQRMPKDGSRIPKKVGQVEKVLFVPYGPLQGPVDLYIHTDYDYCLAKPCLQGGRCTGGNGWYRCICEPGTGGALCENEIPLPGGVEPNLHLKQSSSGASVGGILGGLLLVVLIVALVAFVCYKRGRGDGREESDTIPIVFATGNHQEPPIPMEEQLKAKEAELGDLEESNRYEHPLPMKGGQSLGACGSDSDMLTGDNPPSYYEATKPGKKTDYEPLII